MLKVEKVTTIQRGIAFNSDASVHQGQHLIEKSKSNDRETERNQTGYKFRSKELGLFENGYSFLELTQKLEKIVDEKTHELESALKEANQLNQKYEYSSLHDALTDLPNRRYLRKKLDEFIIKAKEKNDYVALLHIDLDRFKQINDSLGHAAGDHVLQYVAQVLKRAQKQDVFPARFGGDEFIVIAIFDGTKDVIDKLAQTILEELSRDISYQGTLLRFGASIGIAYDKAEKVDPRKLIHDADLALYQVKENGRGDISYFTNDLAIRAKYKNQLLDELYTAIEQEQFIPYYHPRVNAETRSIDGFEVLARWQHPRRGILIPESFLEAADELCLLDKIDHIILEKALKDFHEWKRTGVEIPDISVNMSHARLTDPTLIDQLKLLRIPHGQLHFELTESALLDEISDDIISKIKAIKEFGIGIEIDDFGSAQSSILSTMHLNPTTIKIDSRIINEITSHDKNNSILEAILKMGQALDVKTIVEGVQSYEDVTRCIEAGYKNFQGHIFSIPMPSKEVPSFIESFEFKI